MRNKGFYVIDKSWLVGLRRGHETMTHVGVEELILQTDEKKCTSRGHGWWGGGTGDFRRRGKEMVAVFFFFLLFS